MSTQPSDFPTRCMEFYTANNDSINAAVAAKGWLTLTMPWALGDPATYRIEVRKGIVGVLMLPPNSR